MNGYFHPKVIWWVGAGAYIGSANLTRNGWYRNVKYGVFLTQNEIVQSDAESELDALFQHLLESSLPLTTETYEKLRQFSAKQNELEKIESRLKSEFNDLFGHMAPQKGLITVRPKGESSNERQQRFVREWTSTLELLRSLRRQFLEIDKKPAWVAPDAQSAVHFDQFLHAYYYSFVRATDDQGNSVEKVERFHNQNRARLQQALAEAVDWWAQLETAPGGEDEFIAVTAKMIRDRLSKRRVREMGVQEFNSAMKEIHAYRMHARQVRNETFGLPAGHAEKIESRVARLSEWLWDQRSQAGRTVREVLEFVLYETIPSDMEMRLWTAVSEKEWKIKHFGKSILGEAIGWARPEEYPPRNNRTNKALRALGHDVVLFGAE